MCWHGVYVDLTDDLHANNDGVGVKRYFQGKRLQNDKRPYQQISFDAKFYDKSEFEGKIFIPLTHFGETLI